MPAPSLLILPAQEGGEAILATPSGSDYVTSRILPTTLSEVEAKDLILILPGQLVRIFETELPKSGRAQQLKMARFAKEDDIASSAEDLHFALSDAQPPHLAVIEKGLMDVVAGTFGALRPKGAYADYDLLEGEHALRVIDRAVEPGRAALDLDWTEETLAQPSDAELAKRFSEGLSAGRGINLFQGDYRAKSGLNVPRVPMIRFAALAASALLALFVWNGVQDRVALAQAQDLRTKTATEYSAVTGNRAPTNPGRVAAQSLNGAPTQKAGFLDLSSVLFAALSSLDDIRVDQLRFNAENGTFQLRLIYPSFDAAARVENAVRQAGGELTTGGVREQNGVFVGEASLTMGDPS